MQNTKKLMTAAMMALTLIVSAPVMLPTAASAQPVTADSFGVQQAAATGLPNRDFRLVVASIIRVLLGLLGTVCVIIILYAGFLWMTAGGNDEKVGEAKKWITGAAIGLALILMSYALTNYIITQLVAATTGTGTGSGTL